MVRRHGGTRRRRDGVLPVALPATPGGLTGGSLVGLWYGIIGSALMIYAGLLSLLRRVPSWWWIGSRKVWLRGHIWLGTAQRPVHPLSQRLSLGRPSRDWFCGSSCCSLWPPAFSDCCCNSFCRGSSPRASPARRRSSRSPTCAACMRNKRRRSDRGGLSADDKLDDDVKAELRQVFRRGSPAVPRRRFVFLVAALAHPAAHRGAVHPPAGVAGHVRRQGASWRAGDVLRRTAAAGRAGTLAPLAARLAAGSCAAVGRAARPRSGPRRRVALLLGAGGRCHALAAAQPQDPGAMVRAGLLPPPPAVSQSVAGR